MKENQQNKAFERQPWHLNVTEIAAWMGVNRDTLHSKGLLANPVAKVGRETIHDIRQVMHDHFVASISLDTDGNEIDIEVERKRKLKAERIGQEIRNAQAMGELAPLDLMTSALGDALQSANAWLEGVPAQVKRVWPEADGSVLEMIERECAKVRNSIADARINYTDPRMQPLSDGPGHEALPN